jgi:hypothetical protein
MSIVSLLNLHCAFLNILPYFFGVDVSEVNLQPRVL